MKIKASELPATPALAYLGDAVHSLYVRRMLVARGTSHSGELNALSHAYVTAEAQAEQAARVLPYLTEDEADLYRRAYNSKHLSRPKHTAYADYRAATGWEAVLGMLHYIGNDSRAAELIEIAFATDEEKKGLESHDTEN